MSHNPKILGGINLQFTGLNRRLYWSGIILDRTFSWRYFILRGSAIKNVVMNLVFIFYFTRMIPENEEKIKKLLGISVLPVSFKSKYTGSGWWSVRLWFVIIFKHTVVFVVFCSFFLSFFRYWWYDIDVKTKHRGAPFNQCAIYPYNID